MQDCNLKSVLRNAGGMVRPFWDHRTRTCPIRTLLAATKCRRVRLRRFLQRQKADLPGHDVFCGGKRQTCPDTTFLAAAKGRLALSRRFWQRPKAGLPGPAVFGDGHVQFSPLEKQVTTISCNLPPGGASPPPILPCGAKSPGNDGTAGARSRHCRGLRETAGRQGSRWKGCQVIIRVTVCDQGPATLSLPMILQRKEYSLPGWKPTMSIWVQSPKLSLWCHPSSTLGSPSVTHTS